MTEMSREARQFVAETRVWLEPDDIDDQPSSEDIYDRLDDALGRLSALAEATDSAIAEALNDAATFLDTNPGGNSAGYKLRIRAQRVAHAAGVDTESSASRQHYIETGRYLNRDEVLHG